MYLSYKCYTSSLWPNMTASHKNRRYQNQCTRVTGVTIIMYAQSQNVEKSNNQDNPWGMKNKGHNN